MSQPQFKIHGKERRIKKKTLSDVKSFVKNFWRFHQLEKDMGCKHILDDKKAEKMYNDNCKKIELIELELSIPY